MRNTWRWFDYSVHCEDCDFETSGKNGLGNAARHHDRTGHTVNVDVSGNVTYCSDSEQARRKSERTARDNVSSR